MRKDTVRASSRCPRASAYSGLATLYPCKPAVTREAVLGHPIVLPRCRNSSLARRPTIGNSSGAWRGQAGQPARRIDTAAVCQRTQLGALCLDGRGEPAAADRVRIVGHDSKSLSQARIKANSITYARQFAEILALGEHWSAARHACKKLHSPIGGHVGCRELPRLSREARELFQSRSMLRALQREPFFGASAHRLPPAVERSGATTDRYVARCALQ